MVKSSSRHVRRSQASVNQTAGRRPVTAGIDVGTSGCKGALYDERAGLVEFTSVKGYPTIHRGDGTETQCAGDWLVATRACLRELAAMAAERDAAIEGICVTGPAHGAVIIGAAGVPLAPVMLPYDTRSSVTAERLAKELGPSYFDRTYVRLGPSWTLAQLAWLFEQSPQLADEARLVLVTKDYISWSLTGRACTDASDAAGTGLFDQVLLSWDLQGCTAAGMSIEQLPLVMAPTDVAGGLASSWASDVGITAGTPVVVGATDTFCELVSLGVAPGAGLVKIASTGTVVGVLREAHPDPRLMTYPFLDDNWYAISATNAAAAAYRWLQEALGGDDNSMRTTFAAMDCMANESAPGSGGALFLPFLTGERGSYWDGMRRGAFLGLSSSHRRADLCRAVLEGVAFSLRDSWDLLSGLGIEISWLPYYTGGGMSSQLWRRVLASVLGRRGLLAEPQGPALGAALIAVRALTGVTPRLERRVETVCPDPSWQARYDQLYQIYRTAANLLGEVDHALVRLGTFANQ